MSNAIIAPVGATFLHEGATLPFIPQTDVPAGSVVALDRLVGITKFAIAAGVHGGLAVQGVFEVVKDPTTNIPVGTKLYWSSLSMHVVKTASSQRRRMGHAITEPPRCGRHRLQLHRQSRPEVSGLGQCHASRRDPVVEACALLHLRRLGRAQRPTVRRDPRQQLSRPI